MRSPTSCARRGSSCSRWPTPISRPRSAPRGGASDLVQDTLAAALRNRNQFRGTTFDDLRAWLRAILQNQLTRFHRHYAGVDARDVGREVAADFAGPVSSPSPAALDRLIRDEETRSLSLAVRLLPDDLHAAVVLRVEHALPFAEIGERLGRSEDAARKLFHRALQRLRGDLPDPHG